MDACILRNNDAEGQPKIRSDAQIVKELPGDPDNGNVTSSSTKVNREEIDPSDPDASRREFERLRREAFDSDPTSRYASRTNEADLRRFLSHMMPPDSPYGLELRTWPVRREGGDFVPPKMVDGKRGHGAVWSGIYTNSEAIVNLAFNFKGVSVYACIGPVDLGLLEADRGRTPQVVETNVMHLSIKETGVTSFCVRVLQWLFIDIDPDRPPTPADDPGRKFNASDRELAETVRTRDQILADHPALAKSAIWGISGNGSWIFVRLADLPNDSTARDAAGNVRPGPNATLIAQSLALIARRYSRPGANIDVAVKNAARLGPLIGLLKCKDEHSPERPRRIATLDSPPLGQGEVLTPCDLQTWFDRQPEPDREAAIQKTRSSRCEFTPVTTGPLPFLPGNIRAFCRDLTPRIDAIFKNRIGRAVMGNHGSNPTFDAACVLIKGFDMSPAEAMPHLERYNRDYCQPLWTPHELLHKLESADESHDDRPRGYLLLDSREQANFSGGSTPFVPPMGDFDLNWDDEPTASAEPAPHPVGQALAIYSPPPLDGEPVDDVVDPPQDPPSGPFEPITPPCNPDDLPIDTPQEIARRVVVERFYHPESWRLKRAYGEFYEWDGRRYRVLFEETIKNLVTNCTDRYFTAQFNQEKAAYEKAKAEDPETKVRTPKKREVTTSLVRNVVGVIASMDGITVPEDAGTVFDTWVGCEPPWAAAETIPMNVLVHYPSLARGIARTTPATPRFFSTFALDYDFDPYAPEPTVFIDWLHDIWNGDRNSIDAMQEWMGYCMTPDTDLQKMVQLYGESGAGKGVITRVIRGLVGPENTAFPTVQSLSASNRFGLMSLIGKRVGVCADVRMGRKTDKEDALGTFLGVSGQDPQTIDRKGIAPITIELIIKFMLVSNEFVDFRDPSSAYLNRLITFEFTKGHRASGTEDTTLTDKFLALRPALLNWAAKGYGRLRGANNGKFTVPGSHAQTLAEMVETSNPVKAWGLEACEFDPDFVVSKDDIHAAYVRDQQDKGIEHPIGAQAFKKQFRTSFRSLIEDFRPNEGGKRKQMFTGVRLKEAEPDYGLFWPVLNHRLRNFGAVRIKDLLSSDLAGFDPTDVELTIGWAKSGGQLLSWIDAEGFDVIARKELPI